MHTGISRSVRKNNQIKEGWAFDAVTIVILCVILVFTVYPFLNTIAISLNESQDSMMGGIDLIPRKFTIDNYKVILDNQSIYHAAIVSALRTVIGTVLGLFCTALLGYILAQSNFVLNRFLSILVVITMYIGAGIIPTYFLMRMLGLINNFWVYIVPNLCAAYNVILVRTYMKGIPPDVYESARLDGASEFVTFLRIIAPMCKPVLATVALYIAVEQWNSWFDTYIYASGKSNLSTLQYELMRLVQSQSSANTSSSASVNTFQGQFTPLALRSAITVIAAVPILMVYPFLQNYFVAGMNIGSVKG